MEITTYRPGSPSWIELATSAPDRAAAFYRGLFDWQVADPTTNPPLTALLRGRPVAGFTELAGSPSTDRPEWTTYLTVDDVDATAATVGATGGRVITQPADATDGGRFAICADPTGAVFGVRQPGTLVGAGLAREHGTVARSQVETWDPDPAVAFYETVFDWTPTREDVSGRLVYDFHAYDEVVAGLLMMDDNVPAEVGSNWMVYFDSNDVDGTAELAARLGGEIIVPPTDTPVGRFAILADALGAVFGVIRMS
jgi:predicted enzyme related to lactoylglutathione lyase